MAYTPEFVTSIRDYFAQYVPSGAGINSMFASPPPIGSVKANTGAFTSLTSNSLATTGSVGGGYARTDAGVETQGISGVGGAIVSIFNVSNPGVTIANGQETAVVWSAYDSAGAIKKNASLSSGWGNTNASTGYSRLRFNVTKNGGSDNVDIVMFGGGGISMFNGDTTTAPGDKILSIGGTISPSSTSGILGTTTNDNAIAGRWGEYASANLAQGSATSITTATTTNITSVSLTPGDWDVGAVLGFTPASTTVVTNVVGAITTTSATLPSVDNIGGYFQRGDQWTANGNKHLETIPTTRISVSSTTTAYLVTFCSFSVSTLTAFGSIRARRVR